MYSIASLLVRAALLTTTLVTASPLQRRQYPAVGACSGQCEGRLHDPSVIYNSDSQTYYRFTTNDGINVASAPALIGPWTDIGSVLPNGSVIQISANQDIWAPDINKVGNTYYLYYAVSEIGSQNSDIGVATSTTMQPGSWTDHGSIGIPADSNYNKIDGNLFAFDENNMALTFGSFWTDIYQIPMQNPPLQVTGDVAHLAQNTTYRNGLVEGAVEGAFMFRWGTFNYLFFSSGNCCNEPAALDGSGGGLAPPGEEYKIMVCRSPLQSAGFVDEQGRDCLAANGGTLVLGSHDNVYAPGGQGVMYDANVGAPVVYYHYVNPSVSYGYDNFFFGWSKLDFSSGWPVVVG